MSLIADTLLITGSLSVAFYCFVLSRRLSRFTDLERGMGGAIAVLSSQVDDLTVALAAARDATATSGADLDALTARAEAVSRTLELQVASLHDIAPPVATEAPAPEPTVAAIPDTRPAGPAPVQSFFSHRAAGAR